MSIATRKEVHICPYCDTKCLFNPIIENWAQCDHDGRAQAPFVCQNCHGIVVIRWYNRSDDEILYPHSKNPPKIKLEPIPDSIRADYLESLTALGEKGYISASIMARRAIQQVCRAKSAKGNNLKEEIDSLQIDTSLKELAHKVRLLGNVGAHPDILLGETVTEDDAMVCIGFLEQFLNYVYVIPFDLEQIEKKAAEGRKPKQSQ